LKYTVVLLTCLIVAGAQVVPVISSGGSTDLFNLYLVNDWLLSSETAQGLDVFITSSDTLIIGVDVSQDVLRFYNTSGVFQSSISLAASNTNCVGVVCNNDPDSTIFYTNDGDYVETELYFTDDGGVSWNTVSNPAGYNGRGMDFDGNYYWEAYRGGGSGLSGVWRFVPGGSQDFFTITEVGSYPSGLTVFPYGSDFYIALASAIQAKIFFYQWDGSSLAFVESVDCPVSGTLSSLGLAYSEVNGHIYWSYNNSEGYHLAEFSFEPTALERVSWGSVKSAF
jgi:hypothetical protein